MSGPSVWWRERSPRYKARTAFGAVSLVFSVVYLVAASQLSLGSLDRPGPGVFPILAGVGLLVASVLIGAQAQPADTDRAAPAFPPRAVRPRVIAFFVVIALYSVAVPVVSFVPATIVATVLMQRLISPALPWWKSVMFSVVFTFAVYLSFNEIFSSRLP